MDLPYAAGLSAVPLSALDFDDSELPLEDSEELASDLLSELDDVPSLLESPDDSVLPFERA